MCAAQTERVHLKRKEDRGDMAKRPSGWFPARSGKRLHYLDWIGDDDTEYAMCGDQIDDDRTDFMDEGAQKCGRCLRVITHRGGGEGWYLSATGKYWHYAQDGVRGFCGREADWVLTGAVRNHDAKAGNERCVRCVKFAQARGLDLLKVPLDGRVTIAEEPAWDLGTETETPLRDDDPVPTEALLGVVTPHVEDALVLALKEFTEASIALAKAVERLVEERG